MPWYQFHQNNSGGRFQPPAIKVWIQADNADQANIIATENGIYFDGVYNGIDCSCCGDRWSVVTESDAEDTINATESSWVSQWAKDDGVPVTITIIAK